MVFLKKIKFKTTLPRSYANECQIGPIFSSCFVIYLARMVVDSSYLTLSRLKAISPSSQIMQSNRLGHRQKILALIGNRLSSLDSEFAKRRSFWYDWFWLCLGGQGDPQLPITTEFQPSKEAKKVIPTCPLRCIFRPRYLSDGSLISWEIYFTDGEAPSMSVI